MRPLRTLLLTRRDVTALLDLDECIDAVEQAFILHTEGRSIPPGVLGIPCTDGGFHVKAAGLELGDPTQPVLPGFSRTDLGRTYVAVKNNSNFHLNPTRFGLPAIQGVIVLFDRENGFPLAVMDSIAITTLRTGAATAVAARRLALRQPTVVTICGCGNQGRVQLRALSRVLRIVEAFAFDADPARARGFAVEMAAELGIGVTRCADLADAVRRCSVCVTCTPSRAPFLGKAAVMPGTFVAAVGADSHDKQELDPALLASSAVIVDSLGQCATIGELHHALDAGLMTRDDVRAELGEVLAGRKAGRVSDQEVVIFDSTGTALQDVAAAALVYEQALKAEMGTSLDLIG